jgi:hypothetical protein
MWAARIMKLPLGEWLIGLAGLMVAVYGVSQIVIAARRNASKSIDVTRIPRSLRNPLVNVGRFGVAARAVIIVVLGIFLVRAALQHDPTEALGIRGSILQLAGVFEGRWVLAAIACGLIAYAVEQALHAWCRRIRAPI